jgi:hypothetical protein
MNSIDLKTIIICSLNIFFIINSINLKNIIMVSVINNIICTQNTIICAINIIIFIKIYKSVNIFIIIK